MSVDHCVKDNQIVDVEYLRITFRQGMGSLIWVHQTWQDVGFTIAQIAADSKAALPSVLNAKEICRKYNRIVRFMRNHQRKYTIPDVIQWRPDRLISRSW